MKFKRLMLFVLLVVMAITAFSDGGFYRIVDPIGSYRIRTDMQRAAILYDDTTNKERLILQILLAAELDQVGWIIALPSMPDMYEWEHDNIFEVLNKITNEALTEDHSKKPGCMGITGGCAASGDTGLHFFETVSVGQLDLTPIQAENSQALITWLINNEVSFEDIDEDTYMELMDIMDHYIQNEWIFIYGKFNIEPDHYGTTQLLTFDFDCYKPFYPMMLTKIQQKMFNQAYLEVRLWVIADQFYQLMTIENNQPAPYNDFVDIFTKANFSIEPSQETQTVLELENDGSKKFSFFDLDYDDLKAFEDIW